MKEFIILLLIYPNVWCFEEELTLFKTHEMCKGGQFHVTRTGDLQCCISLPYYKTQCFPIERHDSKELVEELRDLQLEDRCEDGTLFESNNDMYCCRPEDDALDRMCELIPYRTLEQEGSYALQREEQNFDPDFEPPPNCFLPPVSAPFPCKGMMERYYFNVFSRRCEKFIFSGCRGTENNFETLNECMETCLPPFYTY